MEPLGRRNYKPFAGRYAAAAKSKPHNAFYERPATLSLLPKLEGKRVLDAGCGPGHYAAELLDRGAGVVAVDVTPEMVELARAGIGGRAGVIEADLGRPLPFSGRSFDVVLCALVLEYIEDRESLFREFFRVLKPGGRLVYSHGHPMSDYVLVRDRVDPGAAYFDTALFDYPWGGFGEPRPVVRSWRRPLGAMLNPLVAAGFTLEAVLEPKPTEAFREADPEGYAALLREPCFLCVRARK